MLTPAVLNTRFPAEWSRTLNYLSRRENARHRGATTVAQLIWHGACLADVFGMLDANLVDARTSIIGQWEASLDASHLRRILTSDRRTMGRRMFLIRLALTRDGITFVASPSNMTLACLAKGSLRTTEIRRISNISDEYLLRLLSAGLIRAAEDAGALEALRRVPDEMRFHITRKGRAYVAP